MEVIGIIFTLVMYSTVCLAKSCDQIHQYRDKNGICQECEMCGPGFEPSQHLCGYGTKETEYKCLPCPKGSYSPFKDYKFCVTCSPCAKRHSEVHTVCTNTSDAKCGQCHSGYFRPQKSDGNAGLECFKCTPDSTHLQCQRKGDQWKVVAIATLSLILMLSSTLVICSCLWCKAKKNRTGSRSKHRTGSRRAFLFNKVSCDSEVVTSGSLEPLTEDLFCAGLPKSPIQAHPYPPCDPNTYSNLPTAEYRDSGAYHNLPTNQFSRTESINVGRLNAAHHSAITHLQDNQLAQSNNRLDDVFQLEIDSFDTNSAPRSLTRDQVREVSQNCKGSVMQNFCKSLGTAALQVCAKLPGLSFTRKHAQSVDEDSNQSISHTDCGSG